jgi:hypothetical protein
MPQQQFQQFPWPIGFGLIGFFIAFFTQFRLKYHVDRDKVLQIEDMSELYPTGVPPKKVLTERGRRLYLWLNLGIGLFVASIIISLAFFTK